MPANDILRDLKDRPRERCDWMRVTSWLIGFNWLCERCMNDERAGKTS